MAYQLRINSNAFEADSNINKLLNALSSLKKAAKSVIGIQEERFGGNRMETLYGINQRSFARGIDWADSDFDQQILSSQWQWKGEGVETRRKNGEIVTEPRNIVDTGALLESKRRENVSSSIVDFEWTAEHAEGVHDGYRSKSGSFNPARPWTEPTLAEIDNVISDALNNGGK